MGRRKEKVCNLGGKRKERNKESKKERKKDYLPWKK